MRKVCFAILFTFLLVIFASANNVEAQSIKVGLGPRYSYITLMGSEEEEERFAGGQLRVKFLSALAVELSIDYRRDFYLEDSFRIQTIPALFSILAYLFPGKSLSPYIIGGGGWYFSQVTFLVEPFKEYDGEVDFGYHIGGGIEFCLLGKVGFHLDYRSIMVKLSPLNLKGDGHLISAGITYYF